MAGAFHFMIIGIAAGLIGFEKMILAFIDRKKARQLNERSNSIFRDIANKYGVKGAVLETVSIVSVLKKGALWAIMIGVPAALGVYDITGLLREMARRNPAITPDSPAMLYTTLELMGGGSWATGVASLCVIAAGIAWAVLWSEAEKELQENLREAVQDLRRAQERKGMSECGEL